MNNENQPLKEIFCTKCQQLTPHEGSVDGNGEFVFHCTAQKETNAAEQEVYHHFIKFPADTTPEQFAELIQKHQETNAGQVQVAKQNEILGALLGVTLQNAPKNDENTVSDQTVPSSPETAPSAQ